MSIHKYSETKFNYKINIRKRPMYYQIYLLWRFIRMCCKFCYHANPEIENIFIKDGYSKLVHLVTDMRDFRVYT